MKGRVKQHTVCYALSKSQSDSEYLILFEVLSGFSVAYFRVDGERQVNRRNCTKVIFTAKLFI